MTIVSCQVNFIKNILYSGSVEYIDWKSLMTYV